MIIETVMRPKLVRTLRVFSTLVAYFISLHCLIVKHLIRRMPVLKIFRRKVRNYVLVMNHSKELRHQTMNVLSKIVVTHSRTAINI